MITVSEAGSATARVGTSTDEDTRSTAPRHPEPIDGTVMGTAQYEGWISESSLNKEQKIRLGWEPAPAVDSDQIRLFTAFRAIADPPVPRPGEDVLLKLAAKENKITGKEVTPFLLQYISEHTKGESLEANIALIKNNAKLGAELAVAWSKGHN